MCIQQIVLMSEESLNRTWESGLKWSDSDFPSIINDRVDGITPIEYAHQLQMFVQLTPTKMVTHEEALCIQYTSRQK